MPEKLWLCLGTYKECVHRSKIFQVLKEIANSNPAAIERIVRLDDFQQVIFDSIKQGAEGSNRELRYSALDLFGTLGCTDDRTSKMIMLEKHKFMPLLAKLLRETDPTMQALVLRAINNFINVKMTELLKEETLMADLCGFVDVVLGDAAAKPG
jgi:hypothetical protein